MTAGEIIASVDALRPNQYSAEQKLLWLRRLDGQIAQELEETHEAAGARGVEDAAPYTVDSVLLAPFPYAEELYTAYLFAQIDLHNAEISKYNQSVSMLAAAWRQLADFINRTRRPKGVRAWRL